MAPSHTKQEDYRIKSLENLIAVVNNPFRKLPEAEQAAHNEKLQIALEEDERISDAKVPKKPMPIRERVVNWDHPANGRDRAACSTPLMIKLRTNQHTKFDRTPGERAIDDLVR